MDDSEKLAFWGIALKPGEPAELDLEDGETLHVTMASFGVDLADKHARSVVTATIRNSEDEGESEKKYALSALTAGKVETVCMDVSFIGEESVTFEVTGKNVVHLVGNFSFENDVDDDSDDSDDGENLIGVYDDDDNEMSDEDDDDDIAPRLLMDTDPPVITELPHDDEKEEDTKKVIVVKKKGSQQGKVANGVKEVVTPKKPSTGKVDKVTSKDKKITKDVKFEKPLVVEEEEEEDDDSEESDDASRSSDDEGEEIRVNAVPPTKQKAKPLNAGKARGGKASSASGTANQSETAHENGTTGPNSARSKRQRKRTVAIGVPEKETPPPNKKSKVSQRPGTPAATKTVSKAKSGDRSGDSAPKKGSRHENVASATPDGKRKNSATNGGPSSSVTPSKEEASTPPSGDASSGKKRRRRSRSRKEGGSS